MTPHFSIDEFTRSNVAKQKGINNVLPQELMENAKNTLLKLEEIRSILKHPIIITSGYRCKELNTAVRGVSIKKLSQHTEAKAVDFICPKYGSPASVALVLRDHIQRLGIDQLIYEFQSWVHVSFDKHPRHDVFTIKEAGRYMYGIII